MPPNQIGSRIAVGRLAGFTDRGERLAGASGLPRSADSLADGRCFRLGPLAAPCGAAKQQSYSTPSGPLRVNDSNVP